MIIGDKMNTFIYITIGIIIILLLIIWIINDYNAFQDYIIRINEVDANIDTTLRKRYDLLMKANEVMTKLLDFKDDALPEIKKLKDDKKISSFDLDRRLYESLTTYYGIREDNPELKKNEDFVKTDVEIHNSESEIGAYRRYYNDCITKYNKLVKSFPSNIIGLFTGQKVKPYYDGKNQYDENIDDFKL
jgi:LemA protein